MALPFTLKSILMQEKNYGNSNISPLQKYINLQKKKNPLKKKEKSMPSWSLGSQFCNPLGVQCFSIYVPCLALVGKDIVLRFIIEYTSLKDFGPLGNNRSILIRGFLKEG